MNSRITNAIRFAMAVVTAWPCAGFAAPPKSAHYRLSGGGFTSASGRSTSATRVLLSEIGTSSGAERSSGETSDVVGGFIGQAFSTKTKIAIDSPVVEYVSIAFPLAPVDIAVTSVLDELGEPDPSQWRLGHWSPEDSAYVEAAEEDLEEIERGHGYFLITAKAKTIVQDGLPAPPVDFEIDLEDGPAGRPAYNHLGNPFLFPIAIRDLVVKNEETELTLLDPENTLTEQAVKVYDPATGSYITNPPIIEPGVAFWVKKLAPGPVTLLVEWNVGVAPPATARAKPRGSQWAVGMTIRQGGRASEQILVGAAAVAADRWNALSFGRSPNPPGRPLTASIHQADWGRFGGDYVRMFRPAAQTMTWDVAIQGAEWPGEMTLDLEKLDVPSGARIFVSDPKADWTQEVTDLKTVRVAARSAQTLRVTVSLLGAPAPEVRFVDAFRHTHPNPFHRSAGLVFTLAQAAVIETEIYDVTGRRIRSLRAASADPGERVLVWDGNDRSGRQAPPGIYLARYRAGAIQGVTRLVKVE